MKKRYPIISVILTVAALLSCPSAVAVSQGNAAEASEASDVYESYRNTYQYIEPDIPTYAPPEDEISANRSTLPTSYDSRSKRYITSVRDQNPYGSCWTFSAMAAMEASLLRAGGTVDGVRARYYNLDLSELQLAYYFYNSRTDPLGLTAGDYTFNPTTMSFLDRGGNDMYTVFALSGWYGAVAESKVPYRYAQSALTNGIPQATAYNAAAHLRDAYFVKGNQTDVVKSMIMEYGAVAASYYSDNSLYLFDSDNKTTSYYHPTATSTNHAVALVGWDDDFPASSFTAAAPGNGAFLVKNSWGTLWGTQAGYFWISYYDGGLNSAFCTAYIAEDAAKHDYNYHYDGSAIYRWGQLPAFGGGSTMSAVYTASDADQLLEAVTVALYDTNVSYEVQVYTDLARPNTPTRGTAMLAQPVTGITSYTGVYTIDLPEPVLIEAGQTFSVVIRLTKPESETDRQVKVFIDGSATYSWIGFHNEAQVGHTLVARTSGTWIDTTAWFDSATELRIHALTSMASSALTANEEGFSATDTLLCTDGVIDADDLLSRISVPEGFTLTLTDSVGRNLSGAVPTGAKIRITNPAGCITMFLDTVIPGDCNSNGIPDSNDGAIIRNVCIGLETLTAGSAQERAADLNGNGKIDSNDYILLRRAVLGQ